MTKARLIYLLLLAALFATMLAHVQWHGMSDGGGF